MNKLFRANERALLGRDFRYQDIRKGRSPYSRGSVEDNEAFFSLYTSDIRFYVPMDGCCVLCHSFFALLVFSLGLQ
jgi:hypothetical protein